MIPLRLSLTNFLSYRETAEVTFEGIHTACIAGANGAGKSSLLDAMTWALFGQSRNKSDDDLVNRLAARAGEAAEVRYTFDLEGAVYRVIRAKQQGRSLQVELQLQKGDGDWRSLSEGKVRETQSAIETLLGMSYDTFINASFLLQGKADEFTTKTPNKRKEILADLIGVSRWNQYRDQVNQRRREEETELTILDARLADIERELGEEDVRTETLSRLRDEQEMLAERLRDKEQLLESVRRQAADIKHLQELVIGLKGNVMRSRRVLANRRETQTRRLHEREEQRALLAQTASIERDFAAWQAWNSECDAWQQKERAMRSVQERMRPHELAIASERSRLAQQQSGLEAQGRRVAAMQAEREALAPQLAAQQAELSRVEQALAELAAREEATQSARDRLADWRSERQLLTQVRDQLQVQAREMEAAAQREEDLLEGKGDTERAIAELEAKLAGIKEEHEQLMRALAERDGTKARQAQLKERMTEIKERMERLVAEKGGDCPLCGQPLSAAHREAVLADLDVEGKALGEQYRANQARLADLEAETANSQKQVALRPGIERDLTAQRQRLTAAETQLETLGDRLIAWREVGAKRLTEVEARLADSAAYRALEAELAALEKALADRPSLSAARAEAERAVSTTEARLGEIERAATDWSAEGEAELAAVRATLADEAFALEDRQSLAALAAELQDVGYDAAAHEAARKGRDALAEAQAARQALDQARSTAGMLDEALTELATQIEEESSHLAALEEQLAQAEARLTGMIEDAVDLKATEKDVFALREQVVQANRRVGAAEQQLTVLKALRAQRVDLRERRAALTQRIGRLRLLERACSRDGVQALLIEQALPEIEDSANELLERLTDGQMRVLFETQRQLKTRDELAETLDIHISDGVGERPYESFSGGEQFRVNFAIRLALSRVLAQRAGVRLRTLVIDEGFGSQDPLGRQRLVEAINTIQDDFGCILVITHIDQLRDAFPTRIQVEKEAGGSTVTVV